VFNSKKTDKKIIEEDYNNILLLNDIRELNKMKYTYIFKAKKFRGYLISTNAVAVIVAIFMSMLTIGNSSTKEMAMTVFFVEQLLILSILVIIFYTMVINKLVDMASKCETLVLIIDERIKEIKSENWDKAQKVKIKVEDNVIIRY